MTEAEAKILRRRELEDVKSVLSTEAGRRFMWRFLEEAQMFSGTFTGDALSSAYNEGRREFALKFFRDVAMFPELHTKMAQENQILTEGKEYANNGE